MKKKFYDDISVFYDEMIDFNRSLENKTNVFKSLFAAYNIETAADIGCGSGLDTIALSSLGYCVTGFDPSAKMIERAEKNALQKKQKVAFVKSYAEKIPAKFNNKFDLVILLGNAIANINPALLNASLKKIGQMLKPGGMVLLQILNYAKILKNKQTIIGVQEKEGAFIIRYYDYLPEGISFNILTFNKQNTGNENLYKTTIYPYKKNELTGYLKANGFTGIKTFGSLRLDKYEPKKSKDLIIFAGQKNKQNQDCL